MTFFCVSSRCIALIPFSHLFCVFLGCSKLEDTFFLLTYSLRHDIIGFEWYDMMLSYKLYYYNIFIDQIYKTCPNCNLHSFILFWEGKRGTHRVISFYHTQVFARNFVHAFSGYALCGYLTQFHFADVLKLLPAASPWPARFFIPSKTSV